MIGGPREVHGSDEGDEFEEYVPIRGRRDRGPVDRHGRPTDRN